MKIIVMVSIIIGLFLPYNTLAKSEEVLLSKCVDGDTAKFIINGKEYSTRFLAIDTPEVKHPKKKVEPYGKEASKYTCDNLKKAKKIIIEYDDNSTKEDKYGRKLGWIFVDDELLQKKIIVKGYAKVDYLYGEYKYTEVLKKEEEKAKKNKIGMWSDRKYYDKNDGYDDLIDKILNSIFRYIRNEIRSMI